MEELDIQQIKKIIEATIMAANGEPVSLKDLAKVFEGAVGAIHELPLQAAINELQQDFNERGIELQEVASGFRFQVRTEFMPWVSKLWTEGPPRYSRALLETLALIAYRQPITRAEIEDVRGVTVSSNIIRTLLEHEWVRVAGYKQVPGKPALYVTTDKLLDHFNLKSIQELPPLAEISDLEQAASQLELVL
jgi:segregation and condensation protein B